MIRIAFFFLLIASFVDAQSKDSISKTKYLEDQIYVGLSFITLSERPEGFTQNGFSNSLTLGFIKDIPVTKNGDFAFGIGLGYGRNTYFQNIKISEIDNSNIFEIVSSSEFNNNKFSTHVLEVPLEIRWRTSTIDKYKFWRVYAGGKISYVFYANAKFKDANTTIKIKGISEINKLQAGLTLGVGYGTWNFNFYYGLSDIFSNAGINETQNPIKINDFRIGLIFYIL